ncbi:MAG: carboxylating nicotinate-nucleotide diphosphorylase [Desulfovibrionaceae bacterium]
MQAPLFDKYFTPQGLKFIDTAICLALDEDGAELTSQAVFSPHHPLRACILAKQETLVVGLPLIARILHIHGQGGELALLVDEGSMVNAGTEVALLRGPAPTLLKIERIALNFICHLSGIANLTRQYVHQLEGTGVALLDTRKTLPGLRWPEKYAVCLGGGRNHRRNLEEMLMLKDNHIDAAGSIHAAVLRLRTRYGANCPPIEVECRTCNDVREAVACTVDRVMMDNMDIPQLSAALALVPANIEAEISGGVTLENIRQLAHIGPRRANFISVGRLTHSAIAADFSMNIKD